MNDPLWKILTGGIAGVVFAALMGLFLAALAESVAGNEAALNAVKLLSILFPTPADTALETALYVLKTLGWAIAGAAGGWTLR